MRINWIERRWFDKRYSIQRTYVGGPIKIHASMCPEVLWLANAVWESVSTSTGCWLWLIGRMSPAANLSHSALTSWNRDKLKGKWRRNKCVKFTHIVKLSPFSASVNKTFLWILHALMFLHRSEPVCGLFIVSTEMPELAEFFQLNISLWYAGFTANNVTLCHLRLATCRCFATTWIDFQVQCFSPATLCIYLLLWLKLISISWPSFARCFPMGI